MFKTVSKNWKYPAVEEGEGSASRSKQREDLIKFKLNLKFYMTINPVFRKNHSADTCLFFFEWQDFKRFWWWYSDSYDLDWPPKNIWYDNHDILLKKLSISFSDYTVKLFQSYLSNHKFTINLDNSFFEVSSISCGSYWCRKDQFLALYCSWYTLMIYWFLISLMICRWLLNVICSYMLMPSLQK